jgi:hypothetical protein
MYCQLHIPRAAQQWWISFWSSVEKCTAGCIQYFMYHQQVQMSRGAIIVIFTRLMEYLVRCAAMYVLHEWQRPSYEWATLSIKGKNVIGLVLCTLLSLKGVYVYCTNQPMTVVGRELSCSVRVCLTCIIHALRCWDILNISDVDRLRFEDKKIRRVLVVTTRHSIL